MNIDFPPPSNGVYNNANSSRQLANYLEHEDMERIDKGIYIEGFFNLSEDNICKSQIINDIDSNIGQLLKTDAKFYAIHVIPSEKELKAMGATEQEQAEAMKRYIREVVIPEYAKNFNKGLTAEDIKFYGKIHFDRSRSNNKLNMHCHLIVSRKDQSNKIKISPLTNHRSTKKGVIKGGFDRKTLFENVEKGFDKLFNYQREQKETFEYCNTMKNGSITDKLQMQELELNMPKISLTDEIIINETPQNQKSSVEMCEHTNILTFNQPNDHLINQPSNYSNEQGGLSSLLSILPSVEDVDLNNKAEDEYQLRKLKKRKKRKRIT